MKNNLNQSIQDALISIKDETNSDAFHLIQDQISFLHSANSRYLIIISILCLMCIAAFGSGWFLAYSYLPCEAIGCIEPPHLTN